MTTHDIAFDYDDRDYIARHTLGFEPLDERARQFDPQRVVGTAIAGFRGAALFDPAVLNALAEPRTEEARFALVHAWRRCQALGRVKVWMP